MRKWVMESRPAHRLSQNASTVAARYSRLDDFAALRSRLDPRGAFRNAWLDRHVLGTDR